MQMKAYSSEEALTVKIDGEIDHHSSVDIREGIDKMIMENRPKALILELSQIDFMDSSGLGLVLGRYRRLSEIGAKMFIQNPAPRVEKILKMAGVDRIIKIVKTEKKQNGERTE